tara:strand:+ start:382 stop:1224 length:843 start_codon:yes stop_codon:yes gene_type:complete
MMNMKNMLGMSGRSMSDGRVRMSNGGSSIGGFMGMNANMGSMLAKDILGEKGRTISNRDREIAANIGRTRSIADVQAMDNEPMMQDRSPKNQMFTIDAAINNLMTEYQMVVRNIPFAETIEEKQMAEMRAQNVADQIDQLQQQKIDIQDNLADMAMSFDSQIGSPEFTRSPMGRTISNQDRQIISDLLDSIEQPMQTAQPMQPMQPMGERVAMGPRVVQTYVDNAGNIFNEMSDGSFGNEKEGRMGKEMFFTLFPSARPTATVLDREENEISKILDTISE